LDGLDKQKMGGACWNIEVHREVEIYNPPYIDVDISMLTPSWRTTYTATF
jgi:hypothetical protein